MGEAKIKKWCTEKTHIRNISKHNKNKNEWIKQNKMKLESKNENRKGDYFRYLQVKT